MEAQIRSQRTAPPSERRWDWGTAQFIDDMIDYLAGGGDRATAGMHMIERGISEETRTRVLRGVAQ